MELKLGVTVTDKITGFKGLVTGLVSYITGCDQALVTPKGEKPHEYPTGQWIDVQRLDFNPEEQPLTLDNSQSNGPDIAPPVR